MMFKRRTLVLSLIFAAGHAFGAQLVGITSMQELARCAAKSGQSVKMKPGVYQMSELLTEDGIKRRKKWAADRAEEIASGRNEAPMLLFSGHNNSFDLSGVTIEVDTKFLSAFEGSYIIELLVTGKTNSIQGLTLTDIGNGPTDKGGVSLAVYGDSTTLSNVTLNVKGSFPYGYGDLLGKGKNSVVRGRKHSGLLICGTDTRLLGCTVISRSFGHCFFIQGGVNTYFENCYAEGEMRPTDEMLAETEGPAFDAQFRTVYPPNVIQPGYMKSLQECGFRTYGSGGPDLRKTGGVTLENCTAKNVRVGFALAADEKTVPVALKDCTAVGCERGYYLTKAVAAGCSGDAQYGPLLYLTGDEPSCIDLTLLPESSDKKVHAAVTVCGTGHVVLLKGERESKLPIKLGYAPVPAGEISCPINPQATSGVKLKNLTDMPLMVSGKAADCTVLTQGPVEQNDGTGIEILKTNEL